MSEPILSKMNHQSSDKQYNQILDIIDYLLEEANDNPQDAIFSPDELKQLKQELVNHQEGNLNPVQLNTIILMLLDYVIHNLKSV